MTTIQAMQALSDRGYRVAYDPSPELPFTNYFLSGHGTTYQLTAAMLRLYAELGTPAER